MPQPSFTSPFTKIYHKKAYAAIDSTQASVSAARKTILIIAGHTGIGYAIAQNFATAKASHVILLARRAEVLQKAVQELGNAHPNTKFHSFVASVTDYPAIASVFASIRSDISSNINVLVTSAAYIPPSGDAMDIPLSETEKAFATNVFAKINLAKEFLSDISTLSAGQEKVFLDLTSLAAHLKFPNLGNYGVTKIAFSEWLAHVQQDLKDTPLRVYSFHPGAVLTEAARAFGMDDNTMDWDDVQLPGAFAVWLASPEGRFLKGRFVWANWDVEEMVRRKAEIEGNEEMLTIGLLWN